MNAAIETRVEELLAQLTTEEKVSLCHANSKFTIAPVERLGIEELTMSDGPHGVRHEIARDSWSSLNWDNDFCTYLPTNTALAATWNPALGETFGKVLGEEARYRGKDIILGPGINIIRHPLCGRNFEYMSEDPCLIVKMVPGQIRAIQSCDTAACVKHYALNNQELDRNNVNVEVSKKALFEIYLKGFEAAVKEGEAWSFMGAYNRYLGQHCCHNEYLVNDVLKGQWGFDGVYLSDWAGVHDTKEAALYGMDIEMGTEKPYNEFYLADAFAKLVEESPEAAKALDDKVRRILRLMLRVKKFDADRQPGSFNTPEHQQATYDIAKEAMVLLKNTAGVLPLKNPKRLLVVGDNATAKHSRGGNSSGVKALYEVSLLEGLQKRFADCAITYVRTSKGQYDPIPMDKMEIIDMEAGCRAFKCEAYADEGFARAAEVFFEGQPQIKADYNSYVFTAILSAAPGESRAFSFSGSAGTALYLNGEQVKILTAEESTYTFTLPLEQETAVKILCPAADGVAPALLWNTGADVQEPEALAKLAAEADAVIYCGGINHNYDTESFDRKDMKLPAIQNEEIPLLLNANPHTVIALTAGSPVEMPWVEEASTILWTWYAGMEGGNAFAAIVAGDVNPSGKLPFTLPKVLADSPAERYGEYQAGNCRYNEGVFVGYRGFDKDGVEPLFCFGHGESYTAFAYTDLAVTADGDAVTATFTVQNTGAVAGAEIAQVYIGRTQADPTVPVRELKGFAKVLLAPGESRTVTVTVLVEDLREYDEAAEAFRLLCREFTLWVGASSRDLRLEKPFSI